MNLEEAIKALKERKKIKRRNWKQQYIVLNKYGDIKDEAGFSVFFTSDDIDSNDWEIYEEPILDKQEKKYLENFLRPFTKAYKKIEFKKLSKDTCFNWIEIYFYTFKEDQSSSNFLRFPKFKKDKHMYEGMKLYKCYTLEELGLFR